MEFTSTKKKNSSVDLLHGGEAGALLRFSVPIIFSYLLQQIYTISDAAICGQTLTADEVAGVNDVFPLIFIFLQFAFGCTAGFSVVTSIKAGCGDKAGVRKSFAAQIILGAAVTVVLTAIAISSLSLLLAAIGVTPDNPGVWQAAHDYCLVIFIGIFAQLYYNLVCSVLRSLGDSVTPLIFLLVSTVLNIGLDILFIVSFRWGVIGAAAATVLAQALSAAACFVYSFVKYPDLRLRREDFRLSASDLTRHLRQGVPLGLQFSVLAIGIIVMQGSLVSFDIGEGGIMTSGNPAQNGFGAANKLNNFLMCPMNAIGAAIVSFNAQNYGAGEFGRIRRGTLKSLGIIMIMYVVLAGIGLLLTIGGAYQHLFLSADKISAESVRFGNIYLYVDLSMYFILGALFVTRSGVQGVGHSEFTLLAGCAELVARTLVCWFLPAMINGGAIDAGASKMAYAALCAADPVAWLLADIALAYPTFRYLLHGDKAAEKEKQA